jgi:5,10-methylenetetrahydromethanopterin reductase
MTTVRLGIAAMCRDMHEYLAWAPVVENAGYDLLAYGDTQNLLPDPYVALTAMAMRTTRVRLCSTVTNPVTRHVTVAASGFGALQQVSGGRAIYGIGTGDSALVNIGRRRATVDQLAAHCRSFRSLVRGEAAVVDGVTTRLSWPVPSVPLYLAAEGPRTMALAGEVGDGVIFGNGITREVVEDDLRRVRTAAVAAGRDPEAIEPWFVCKVVITDRPEREVWHDLAWTTAATANHALRGSLDEKFVPVEHHDGLRRLFAGYDSSHHNDADHTAHHARLVHDNGLTDLLGQRFLVAGPPGHVAERLLELASWGASNLLLTAVFGDPIGYTRRVAEALLPRLG